MTIFSFAPWHLGTFALVPVTSLNLSHVTRESFISIMIWEPCCFLLLDLFGMRDGYQGVWTLRGESL